MTANDHKGPLLAVEPAPKPGGYDFATWSYNMLPERTGNVGWQPDLQDLIYTAINHVEGDYEDADENCAEQVIERLVLAIKDLLVARDILESRNRRLYEENGINPKHVALLRRVIEAEDGSPEGLADDGAGQSLDMAALIIDIRQAVAR